MSALEQSIRKFDEELAKSVIKPEIGTSFGSLGKREAEFLRMLGGSVPMTILTDQNRAMEVAISRIFPQTVHM